MHGHEWRRRSGSGGKAKGSLVLRAEAAGSPKRARPIVGLEGEVCR